MSHTITTAWKTTSKSCQARLASNCSGDTSGTVDRLRACDPCIAEARRSNNDADRRRG